MYILPTDSTPEVDLNFTDGRGYIRGRFAIPHPADFFQKINEHLEKVLADPECRGLVIELRLEEMPSIVLPHLKSLFDALRKQDPKSERIKVEFLYPKGWRQVENFVRSLAHGDYNMLIKGVPIEEP
jgi:hypothetical protein